MCTRRSRTHSIELLFVCRFIKRYIPTVWLLVSRDTASGLRGEGRLAVPVALKISPGGFPCRGRFLQDGDGKIDRLFLAFLKKGGSPVLDVGTVQRRQT